MKGTKKHDEEKTEAIAELVVEMEHSCILDLTHNDTSYTLEETGRILQVTRERARQVEVHALVKLRRGPDSEKVKAMTGMD
jgi:DNA-directed RNA polymerase sigma subunit (sigma70/sigma32)